MSKPVILIADDSEVSIQEVKTVISEMEIDPDLKTAKDGIQTMESIYSCLPDLIVLDIEMPIFHGTLICKHLKNHEYLKNIKVILFTSLDRKAIKKKIEYSGNDAIVFKKDESRQEQLKKHITDFLGETEEGWKERWLEVFEAKTKEKGDLSLKKRIQYDFGKDIDDNEFNTYARAVALKEKNEMITMLNDGFIDLAPTSLARNIYGTLSKEIKNSMLLQEIAVKRMKMYIQENIPEDAILFSNIISIDEIKNKVFDILDSGMKMFSAPRKYEIGPVNVRLALEKAVAYVSGRLNEESIELEYAGFEDGGICVKIEEETFIYILVCLFHLKFESLKVSRDGAESVEGRKLRLALGRKKTQDESTGEYKESRSLEFIFNKMNRGSGVEGIEIKGHKCWHDSKIVSPILASIIENLSGTRLFGTETRGKTSIVYYPEIKEFETRIILGNAVE